MTENKVYWTKSTFFKSNIFYTDVNIIDNRKVEAKCVLCKRVITAGISSCSNLRRHYRRVHISKIDEYDQQKVNLNDSKAAKKRFSVTSNEDVVSEKKSKKLTIKEFPKVISQININKLLFQKSINVKSPEKKSNQLSKKESSAVVSQININKLLLKFIVSSMLPMDIVNNEDFREYVKASRETGFPSLCSALPPSNSSIPISTPKVQTAVSTNSKASVPDVTTLSRSISTEYQSVKNTTIKDLESRNICLTADIWSEKQHSTIEITAHWITDNLERRSAYLARKIVRSSRESLLTKHVHDACESYKITSDQIVAIVTDNRSNFLQAFKVFGIKTRGGEDSDEVEREETDDHKSSDTDSNDSVLFNRMECISYKLSIICTSDADKANDNKKYKVRYGSVREKLSSLWNKASYPECAETIFSILNCQLTLPCPVRWQSFYDSVTSILDIERSVLNKVMLELQLPEFTNIDYEFLHEYSKVTAPISIALDRLQSDENSYFSDVLPILFSIEACLMSIRDLVYCKPLLEVTLNSLRRRFTAFFELDATVNYAIIATITNPKFKLNWLSAKSEAKEKLVGVLKTYIYEYNDDFSDSDRNSDEIEMLNFIHNTSKDIDILNDYNTIKALFIKHNAILASSELVASTTSRSDKPTQVCDRNFEMLAILKANGSP